MQAVELDNGSVRVREIEIPCRPPGYALIRVLCAGICNTDLELQRGYYGFSGIPGHEFIGTVVEASTPNWIGKRVAGEINLSCGICDWCCRGLARHCPNRTVLGIVKHPGTFAEYVTLPERNLHEVPAEISTEQAVFIEPLAAACEVLDQVEIPPSARIAVLGDGKLGLLIAQVLHAHHLHVVHYGRHASKLAISRAAGIETSTETPGDTKSFGYVVDATGSAEGLRQAVSLTRPRGTIILKSTVHGQVPVNTAPIIVDELTLVGSRCGRFEPAIDLLRSSKVNVAPLLSAEYALEQAPAAFQEAARRGVMKVLLRPGASA